jgi:hypothetical protein
VCKKGYSQRQIVTRVEPAEVTASVDPRVTPELTVSTWPFVRVPVTTVPAPFSTVVPPPFSKYALEKTRFVAPALMVPEK